MYDLSWLNPTPHAIAVYASQPLSPVATQHSLPSGRYSLLGPDFHRLDRTSFAWRTYSITSSAMAMRRRDFDVAFAFLPGLRAGALVIERRFLPWSEQAARSTEAASLFGVLLYVVIDNRPRLKDDYDPGDDPDDI